MMRISLCLGFLLLLLQPAWANTLILDASDIQDWVRVAEYSYPKYQDTMIRPTALMKFQTHEIPEGAIIVNAMLGFKALKSQMGTTIRVSYIKDDSWSYDLTDASDLYPWPVSGTLGTYGTG